MRYYDCPMCGKPESCWGDFFCGECEGREQKEQAKMVQAEKREINRQLRQHRADCECSRCWNLSIALAELHGDFDRANELYNM